MSEAELMPVRAELGMVFQEGALFDSLTVRENVGYRLFEQTSRADRDDRRTRERSAGFCRLEDFGERMPIGDLRRATGGVWPSARALTSRPKDAAVTTSPRPASIRSRR
jgi:phospholipid/cholesterol/gamma-HCH transport system ATP-binding protein